MTVFGRCYDIQNTL